MRGNGLSHDVHFKAFLVLSRENTSICMKLMLVDFYVFSYICLRCVGLGILFLNKKYIMNWEWNRNYS